MGHRPPAALLAELGMRSLNRLVLVPLRRAIVGEDAWTSFYEFGHDGYPWWWYREGTDGRLVLVGPIGSQPAAPVPTRAAPAPVHSGSAAGVSVRLSGGQVTTPIVGYRPEVHGEAVALLDLLCALLHGYDATGGRVRDQLSPSLLARAWGTRTGHTQRKADRYLAELGAARILERTTVGSRIEWHVPADTLQRFRDIHGFTVAQ